MLGGKLEEDCKNPSFLTKKPSNTSKSTVLTKTINSTKSFIKSSKSIYTLITEQSPTTFTKIIQDFFLKTTKIPINYKKLPRDKNGKIMPIGNYHLSISHSEDYLAIAIASENIAIDIEKSTHKEKLTPRLLSKILTTNETEVKGNYLNNFVIKEAYTKYLGTGLSAGLKNYDANSLLKDPTLTWQNLSTEEYSCFVVFS